MSELRPGNGRLCPARPVDEDDGSQRGSPQELASRELVVDLRDVDALPPILHSDHLSRGFPPSALLGFGSIALLSLAHRGAAGKAGDEAVEEDVVDSASGIAGISVAAIRSSP